MPFFADLSGIGESNNGGFTLEGLRPIAGVPPQCSVVPSPPTRRASTELPRKPSKNFLGIFCGSQQQRRPEQQPSFDAPRAYCQCCIGTRRSTEFGDDGFGRGGRGWGGVRWGGEGKGRELWGR